MKKRKRLLFPLVLTFFPFIGLRASADTTMYLSLSEAQLFAIEHNYTLQNASLDVKMAEAAKWEVLSTMLPQVSGKFDYSNMCGYEMNFGMINVPMNPYGSLGVTASLAISAQQITGALLSSISQQMSDVSYKKTQQSVRSNVKSIYVSILVMSDILGLLDSTLLNMQVLERSTIESVKAGASEQIVADQLSVQVAQLQNSINSNRRALKMLYNSMLLQLGANVNTNIVLTSTLDQIIDIEKAIVLTSDGMILENNFDYQLLQHSERISKIQLTDSWLKFAPTITAFYQYSNKTYFGKDEGMNMTPPNMVGASFSLPIFQSGSRIAAIKKAKMSYQETQNVKHQTEDALMVQYNQLSFDLINAIETYRIQKRNLEVSMRVFDNTTEKFKYGAASNLEVTNASNDIITAQSNYVQAVLSVVSAQVELEKLLGIE